MELDPAQRLQRGTDCTLQSFCRLIAALFLFIISSATLPAADVSTKVVDGLGRGVSNAVLDIYWVKSFSKNHDRKIDLAKLVSDGNGNVKGTYDETAMPHGQDIWVDVLKDGYSGYSTTGLRPEFDLKRKFASVDVRRIATLAGKAQVSELRELLAGEFEDSEGSPEDLIFVQEHQFRSALRELIQDPKVGIAAGRTLAFIGVPEDLLLCVDHAPLPKGDSFANRCAYSIVTALLEPKTEKEWDFLHVCAANRYDDLWVDAGAIETLKLIASPRSKEILQKVAKENTDRADSIKEALRYIDSAPPSLADVDLISAGKKVAQAIKIGKWQGNKKPRFNERADMALVDCEFIAGMDLLIHTATFHRVDGVWKLRGVRETMQALLAREPDSDGPADEKK